MKMIPFGKSDLGRVRTNNEDSFRIDSETQLIMVADGMGGHASGEVASRMASDIILDQVRKSLASGQIPNLGKTDSKLSQRAVCLVNSIRLANEVVYGAAKTQPQNQGMGTTVVAALIYHNVLSVAHVGDSRLYVYRKGSLDQLTEDHSLVMDQVRQGLITVEQAEVSPLQNVLSRALGVGEHVDVEANDFPVESGDVILLCSDGLTRMVKDEQILQVLKEKENPQEICENLISMANNAGGKDNVTVIVARIEKEPNTLERLWKAWFSKGESH